MNKITRFYLPSPEVSGDADINVGPFIIQPSHYNKISKEKRMFVISNISSGALACKLPL
jgi:hypothetical protein